MSWLDEEEQADVTAASATASKVSGPSLAEQEREFQKAVQPGSPISALLRYVFSSILFSS